MSPVVSKFPRGFQMEILFILLDLKALLHHLAEVLLPYAAKADLAGISQYYSFLCEKLKASICTLYKTHGLNYVHVPPFLVHQMMCLVKMGEGIEGSPKHLKNRK